jgi:hypothetical protein
MPVWRVKRVMLMYEEREIVGVVEVSQEKRQSRIWCRNSAERQIGIDREVRGAKEWEPKMRTTSSRT